MKKKNTKYVRIQEPVPAPTGYPFINPIILTKDMKIFDGQHRYEVCKDMGRGVECIVVDFNADELSNPDCMARIRDIQQKQTARMESYFKKYDIGYNKQLLWCSAEDRMGKFYEFRDKFKTDQDYWQKLGDNYILSTNNFKYSKELKGLFTAPKAGRDFLMNEKDLEFRNNLPEKVVVFRGMSVEENLSGDFGISWTLNKKIAEKFAFDYKHNYDTLGKEHLVKELLIDKSDIIAYFSDRN